MTQNTQGGDFYRDPRVKPEDDIERSSRGMTQNTQGGIFIEIVRSSRTMTKTQGGDFYRDCPVKPDNDKNARRTMTKKQGGQ